MPRYLPLRFLFRARVKQKKRARNNLDWVFVAVFFVGGFSFFAVLFPGISGLWGQKVARFLGWLSGQGRFILPLLLATFSLAHLFRKKRHIQIVKPLLWLALFVVSVTLLSLLGEAVWNENYGGILGLLGSQVLERFFGQIGSWIVAFGLLLTLGVLMAGLSPSEFFHNMGALLVEDWRNWKEARTQEKKETRQPVVEAQPLLGGSPSKKGDAPKIMGLDKEPSAKETLSKKERSLSSSPETSQSSPSSAPLKASSHPALKKSGERGNKKSSVGPIEQNLPDRETIEKKPYHSPPLDLFDPVSVNKPVSKEELTTHARLLEQTLANFNVGARVVEIHPGPVITRYDLEPAPGVKVSSISSRADDLALAMRSTGIRVLAPIPGKGAVGVEIPNLHPEIVKLRELLETPKFLNHPSPLAFVLGKTVSGDPCIVDLASMPHVLVAGSTGSGKSVCVHTMISSILFRSSPDVVKFVLIDPKRLELPSYTSIPHLYDPRVNPAQAAVITNSKQAAKALMRLVKVMEYRYDLFAKANVRNIDSYNQKRGAKGLPYVYYLVVVIDELADLMLTSPKEVEDSIQRLAQMARAVGIHLVLATQRPSVDVITGVIKANLPARIAMRVSSNTDSRVIIDSPGADSLLGNGDMLYLPPASAEPFRVQGAFVAEREVERLVDYVKQFGIPSYDDLFSSGSALEFAVEDKKEMKELIEALGLVAERRRVSQDLLKAHFGSSARATNILSLLEVKEFIKKPEGSNRWDINFDLIDDFLTASARQPEEESVQ